jgi:hypothetical protein
MIPINKQGLRLPQHVLDFMKYLTGFMSFR